MASKRVEKGLGFGAARVLLAGLGFFAVFVDDVASKGTFALLTSKGFQLGSAPTFLVIDHVHACPDITSMSTENCVTLRQRCVPGRCQREYGTFDVAFFCVGFKVMGETFVHSLRLCFRKDGHCEEMRGTFRQNDSYIQSSIANDLTMRKVGYC